MNRICQTRTLTTPGSADGSQELPGFDDSDVEGQHADAHRVLLDQDRRVVARCSLWWRGTPPLAHHRLGLIGHYASSNAFTGRRLLEQAVAELAARGCTLAVGPMDGASWRRYRFVTERGFAPTFFLEPENPPDWPQRFVQCGFTPLAHYYSSVTDRLDYEDPKANLAEERLTASGIELRSFDASCFEEELSRIYRITSESFRGSFLYQPMPEPEFLAYYQAIQRLLRPELVLIAMQKSRAVGFSFAIPDMLQGLNGGMIDTVVLKTFAVVPNRAFAGLGCFLAQQTHRAAAKLGYRRVIHALMHEANPSLIISRRYGQPFRRYTLFARPL